MRTDSMTDLDKLRYPVGKFEQTPARFRTLVSGLNDRQLDTPYRPGGWTIRQVVHHVPDSHMNAYIRCKWAMTEDEPAIKVYEEQLWAELPEARNGNVDMSLALLEALHWRWVAFLRAIPDAAFKRTFRHPEWKRITI